MMSLIGALGAPGTGKTTAMLQTAYYFKMMGVACEFMPEPARYVIDTLGYADQALIARLEQENIDRAKAHPDRIFLTDSGIYHGQFYGGPVHGAQDYDLVVYFDERYSTGPDSGRIHTPEQSDVISERMAEFARNLPNCVTISELRGQKPQKLVLR
ncbi:ATP-binding protein [Hymenobacter sp. HSC-4F20]|uniref:AAA family ATPase n=1 Tax=Hymenobacter sp. HSC-4F20 TaxID=2864135 RepID=UPI001C7328DF|nr:AAA family ATPase [Hymenobacter sp. HSC-4F20]MBX0289740.1 ATP-binding protein [Hymenobacter sp. HSC-4F20]